MKWMLNWSCCQTNYGVACYKTACMCIHENIVGTFTKLWYINQIWYINTITWARVLYGPVTVLCSLFPGFPLREGSDSDFTTRRSFTQSSTNFQTCVLSANMESKHFMLEHIYM